MNSSLFLFRIAELGHEFRNYLIDDTEYANLKLLCDEIFSERNFMGTFIWKSRQVVDSRNRTHISNDHEYILAYSQNIDLASLLGKEVSKDKYSNPDNDPRGIWMSNSILGLANAEQRPNLHYDLVDPATGIVYPYNPSTGWRFSKDTMAQKIAEGRILFPSKKMDGPERKNILMKYPVNIPGYPLSCQIQLGIL